MNFIIGSLIKGHISNSLPGMTLFYFMIVLHGQSDDLFYSQGDIEVEFDCYQRVVKFTASDGTRGIAEYDGRWNILLSVKGNLFIKQVYSFTDENTRHDGVVIYDGVPRYSDYVILGEGVEWLNINGRKYKP